MTEVERAAPGEEPGEEPVERESHPLRRPAWPVLALTAALIATLGAVCGIGGGLFSTPILHYGFRVPLRRAVATSLALVLGTALSATVTEALRADSALPWRIVGAVAPTALVGAQIGFWMSQRVSTRALKGLFCIVLAIVGARLMLGSSGGEGLPGFAPGSGELLRAAAVGLIGGVVVPLLGVGGGLVLVPAILLTLPDLGYQGARATSLAVATLTAARSLWLRARAGDVDWGWARPFAGGALLGAFLGVHAVHLPGAAGVAQVLLGVTLWVSAVRFGLDSMRPAGPEPAAG